LLTWNPTTSVLLSAGSDGSMRWWDVPSGECVAIRQGHQGAIHIWNIESGEYLQTLRGDRPYERLDISEVKGLTDAQKTTLRLLGAVKRAPEPEAL